MLNKPSPAETSAASFAGALEFELTAARRIYQFRAEVKMRVSNGRGSGSALMLRVSTQQAITARIASETTTPNSRAKRERRCILSCIY